MKASADLEIGLHLYYDESYTVELRFNSPDSDADIRSRAGTVRFDFDALRSHELDPAAYGRCLAESLFADERAREVFEQARAVTQMQEVPLRLRLCIGPTASELHGLRWETLHIAGDDDWLLTGERIIFSRYVDSQDWRGVGRLPRDKLRALVVVANPPGVGGKEAGGRSLAPVPHVP